MWYNMKTLTSDLSRLTIVYSTLFASCDSNFLLILRYSGRYKQKNYPGKVLQRYPRGTLTKSSQMPLGNTFTT